MFSIGGFGNFVWVLCRRLITGLGCGCVYCTVLLFCHFGGGGVHHGIEQLLPIQGVACRGLAVKVWNHRVGSEVEIALVIGPCLGFGCFGIVEWPGQHCCCPRNLWDLCFHSLSSLQFSPSSAQPLDWGYATEDSLCFTHHV